MRLFVAVNIPSDIREVLGRLIEELRREIQGPRWVRADGIHLTLKFLGEVLETDLPGLTRELRRRVAGMSAPFEVALGGIGTFPGRGRPRVLWVGLHEPDGRLAALQACVEQAVEAAALTGVTKEARPFRPHLTLARFGEGARGVGTETLEKHRDTALGSFVVRSVVLYQSLLKPGGAEHRLLEEYCL